VIGTVADDAVMKELHPIQIAAMSASMSGAVSAARRRRRGRRVRHGSQIAATSTDQHGGDRADREVVRRSEQRCSVAPRSLMELHPVPKLAPRPTPARGFGGSVMAG